MNLEVSILEILNSDNIVNFIMLFMPGFIFIETNNLLVASEDMDFSQNLYKVVAYSVIFCGPTYLVCASFSEYSTYICVIGLILIPIFTPFFIKLIRSTDSVQNHILRQENSAWDYVFSSRKTYWVILHLKDGKNIGGLYATQSFTSSFPHTKDIYLEELWHLNKKNKFTRKIPQSAGLWISAEEISSIEFFNFTED